MIEIKGQYIFSASIADLSDFIAPTELVLFRIVERCGNIPPSFRLEFTTENDKILSLLNDGNALKIQFGESLENFEDMELYVSNFSFKGTGERLAFVIEGFAFEPDYTISTKTMISDKKSGIEVIKEKLSGICNVVSNVDRSMDSQNWIQHNITDRLFINQLLARSYSPNSFFLSAITSDKQFIIKDVLKESMTKASSPDWIFSKSDTSKNAVPYSGDYDLQVASGLMSSLVGYGRERVIAEIANGNTKFVNQVPSVYLALTKEIVRKASIEKKFVGTALQSENMHPNYHQAYLNFVVNSIMMGAITIMTQFDDKYRKIRPADWVLFKGEGKKNSTGSSEYTSGFYVVSEVERVISNSELKFIVTLARESFNQARGA